MARKPTGTLIYTKAKGWCARIPVIVLTAMAGEISRLHGLEVGATDYCVKPVGMRELMRRVDAVIATTAACAGPIEREQALARAAKAP